MTTETVFADGFRFERPREGAPSFVKGRMSINVERGIAFLQTHKNERGFVDLDLLLSTKGEPYLKLNTWKPNKPEDVGINPAEVEPFGPSSLGTIA